MPRYGATRGRSPTCPLAPRGVVPSDGSTLRDSFELDDYHAREEVAAPRGRCTENEINLDGNCYPLRLRAGSDRRFKLYNIYFRIYTKRFRQIESA